METVAPPPPARRIGGATIAAAAAPRLHAPLARTAPPPRTRFLPLPAATVAGARVLARKSARLQAGQTAVSTRSFGGSDPSPLPLRRADGLKIYPTLVIRGTGLYELWRTRAYKPYAPDVLIDLVARALALVPPWVRVYRIQRDIPMPLVSAGVERGNLRQLALARMAALGLRCRDVRTREAGAPMLLPAALPTNCCRWPNCAKCARKGRWRERCGESGSMRAVSSS